MRRWLIQFLGGFPDIDSAIDFIKEINDKEGKRKILQEAVKKLYNAIGSDDVLKENPDHTWTFEGRPITQTQVEQLKVEAKNLLGMKLWRAIKLDIRYQIGKKMWEEAKCVDDILAGQMLIFLDDIIRARLQQMIK